MTRWVERTGRGRPRGPAALVRAWVGVLVRPRAFFANGVAPGDQGPGLTFLAAVVLVEEVVRFALVADAYPVLGGRPLLSAILWLLVAVVLVAPVAVHLVAALQTLVLAAAVPDRAGVSETVQVVCYATAPCVLAGVPDYRVRAACALYGAGLYVLGLATVHGTGGFTALAAGSVPATLVFGYGFRGAAALSRLGRTVADAVASVGG